MATCKLCGKEKILCNSHIIPEFFFNNSGIYDEKHRYFVIKIKDDKSKIHPVQKGFYEKLLCKKCEQFLSHEYENYTKDLLFVKCKLENYKSKLELKELNSSKLKLMILSILYRAAVSENDFFKEVELLDSQKEILRSMILDKIPGQYNDFGVHIYIADENTIKEARQVFAEPKMRKVHGHRIVTFFVSCFIFTIFISKHSKKFEHQELFINDDDVVIIPKVNYYSFIKRELDSIINSDFNDKADKYI
ncbi:MAG: hypothetical protein PF487_14225 [Bacteroidales bacterium]|jgi:hypothetical protein|nr:hypothetical protein [Bacteroidales bacterium]